MFNSNKRLLPHNILSAGGNLPLLNSLLSPCPHRSCKIRQKSKKLTVDSCKDELLSIIMSREVAAATAATEGDDDEDGGVEKKHQLVDTLLDILQTLREFIGSDQYKLHSGKLLLLCVSVMV